MNSLRTNGDDARPRLFFIDDDPYTSYPYVQALDDEGFEVIKVTAVETVLEACAAGSPAAVILDVMMQPGDLMGAFETKGGFETGLVLARKLRKAHPDLKLIALTGSESADVVSFFTKDDSVAYFLKANTLPLEFSQGVAQIVRRVKRSPRVFVVHGRDHGTVYELKNYLQNRLGFTEPLVLFERPSLGRTVIEKFENYARRADVAIVVATPDDLGRLAGESCDSDKARARQNVVFEYGFFLGYLKRTSGRVLLLQKGSLDLPSDIGGLIYIDISGGIEAAGEQIRTELSNWL